MRYLNIALGWAYHGFIACDFNEFAPHVAGMRRIVTDAYGQTGFGFVAFSPDYIFP
jgi:hypothetical protein